MKIIGLDLSINGSGCVMNQLDSKLDIIETNYLSFTPVKKNATDKIIHYNKKQFKNYFDQNRFMEEKILDFCEGADYTAIEDYAYGAMGKVFHMAEFAGGIKSALYFGFGNTDMGVSMRLYDPCSIKMFACNKGTAKKEDMIDQYDKVEGDPLNLSFLPQYKSPKEDIVDAYWLTKLLQMELKLRRGLIRLQDLTEKQIQIFNRTTKGNPTNILATDFIELN